LEQGDSWSFGFKTRDGFVSQLTTAVNWWDPEVVIIEDLPHGVQFMRLVKSVCRLQGRIEQSFLKVGARHKILWVPPTVWKQHYKLNGKDTAKLIEPKAQELYGYEPPINHLVLHGKERTEAKKIRTDYAAAYLMGKWAQEMFDIHGTYDLINTARVED
jgi:hypothetical protein